MFHVEKTSSDDFEFAVHLTDTVKWGLIAEDFEFMKKLEPSGCFTLFYDSEKVGVATTISYGKVGWLGNVIVREDCRGKGGGSLLVKSAIEYLISKGVETIGLYSYIHQVPFYEKHDFESNAEFRVLEGKGFSAPTKANVRKANKDDYQQIIDLDKSYFGASRSNLLKSLLVDQHNPCYVSTNSGQIFGFAMAKVYGRASELGPLVCGREHEDMAIDLLKTHLNRLKNCEVSLYIPEKESHIMNLLMKHNFRENFRVERMFHGKPLSGNCIYLAESLERG